MNDYPSGNCQTMSFEQILSAANTALEVRFGKSLTAVEMAILKGSWRKQTYEQIATASGYSARYLTTDIGPKLWKRLSEALGETINKTTCRAVLEQCWRQGAEAQKEQKDGEIRGVEEGGREKQLSPLSFVDWGEAIDINCFYGRIDELATLEHWIQVDQCRLVALLGMGGIGKTALAAKVAHRVTGDGEQQTDPPSPHHPLPSAYHPSPDSAFKYVIWRSLRNAPPLEMLLSELVLFLSNQQDTKADLGRLAHWLRTARCLVVLDNVETILQAGEHAGQYRSGYEGYGDLFRMVGEVAHQSCLILTSREKPAEVAAFEGVKLAVRSLQLKGAPEAARAIIQAKDLSGTDEQRRRLCDRYQSNPLAVKIVATSIQDLFDGEIGAFLEQDILMFNSVRRLLTQQFERLSPLEQAIMYWLAINREWTSIAELSEDIVPPVFKADLLETLESLSWRSLIERQAGRYTQQPVVMEYVSDRLVEQIYAELSAESKDASPHPLTSPSPPLSLLHSHALLKTTVKDYIRESQIRLIVTPIANKLSAALGSKKAIEHHLKTILSPPTSLAPASGYTAGNLINLCRQLQIDLTRFDFSHLQIWQANLQGMNLRHVNFAHSHLAKSVFTQTFGSIQSVSFSSDGKLVAAGDANGQVCLWQVEDGQPISTLHRHSSWVWSVAFSPDGETLASGGADQTVNIWNSQTGQCCETLSGRAGAVRSVAFSADGGILASAGDDHNIRLWDIQRRKHLKTLSDHTNFISSVAFSPDGKTLASGSADQTVKIWNIQAGHCCQTLSGHAGTVRSVAFSSDGQMLASGGDDHRISLWNAQQGIHLKTLSGHNNLILSVAFSPDNKIMASGSADQTVKLWDVHTGRCLKTLAGYTYWVWSVAFNPDGQTLASGGGDQTVKLWDVKTGHCLKTLLGYTSRVQTVAFSADSQLLASGGGNRTVKIWNVRTGQRLKTLLGHADGLRSVAFSPDNNLLASSGADQTIKLWDVETMRCLKTLSGHTNGIWSVAFSPDGQTLVSGSDDQTVRLWHVGSGQCLKVLPHYNGLSRSVAFSPNGRIVAFSSTKRVITLWDSKSDQCFQSLSGHCNEIWSVKFSPDGEMLASCSADRTIKLWDVRSGHCLGTLQGHTHPVWSVAFSADGRLLASGSFDCNVKLWDISTGQCLKTLCEHANGVWSVTFDAAGQLLASGSEDETVKLWDINTGQCVKTLRSGGPYEGMNITGITGLTETQKKSLKALGAVDEEARQYSVAQ